MSRSLLVALGFITAHVACVAALGWPDLRSAGLDLALLLFGATGALEPTPTRSLRHRDVMEAERTSLGRRLLYRDFWRVRSAPIALALLAVVWAATAAVFLAIGPQSNRALAQVFLWTPVALFAVGVLAAGLVNMWVVTLPLLGLWLVALAGASLNGDWLIAARVLAAGAGLVASLFASDLLKTIRARLDGSPG